MMGINKCSSDKNCKKESEINEFVERVEVETWSNNFELVNGTLERQWKMESVDRLSGSFVSGNVFSI